MFDINKFANILFRINESYDSMTEFAEKASFDRSYISKYIHKKLDSPPSSEILKKIADSSKNITTYEELMYICGYFDEALYKGIQAIKYLDKNQVTLEALSDFRKAIGTNDSATLIKFINTNKYAITKEQFKNMLMLQKSAIEVALEENKVIDEENSHLILNNLNVALTYLESIEESNVFPTPTDNKLYMCPVYGRIAAGVPNWAEQCMEGRLPLDPDMMNIHNPEECFFLRVSGESMNKVVKNGGYALIRKQEDVENGDIAVVLVNGYDATLKKFTRKNDMVILEPMSDDSSFEIQIYDHTTQIKILGKYIGKFEMN